MTQFRYDPRTDAYRPVLRIRDRPWFFSACVAVVFIVAFVAVIR